MSFVNNLTGITVVFKKYFVLLTEAETITLQWEYKVQTYKGGVS